MKIPFMKTKKKLRSFDIPKDAVLSILYLLDAVDKALKETGNCRVAKYYLWKDLAKYVPETTKDVWHVKSTANSVTVFEGESDTGI